MTTKRRTGARTRTCVGCGRRDAARSMVRLAVAQGEVVVSDDAPGRGAHLHPRPTCLARAPRVLARALREPVFIDAAGLGRLLVARSEQTLADLALLALRRRLLTVGAAEGAPLLVVAVDGGASIAYDVVGAAAAAGRAIAWRTKRELGALLGKDAVASFAVHDAVLAAHLIDWRARVDAGWAATTESLRPPGRATKTRGAECSRRREAR